MKRTITGVVFFALNCFAALTSCKKNENTNNTNSAVLKTIQSDPTLSIFSAIEAKSGDNELFTNGYSYAVPEDNSFISEGISSTSIQNLSQATCDSIIRYFTIPSVINFNGTANTEISLATSLTGAKLYADSTATGIYFNGVLTDATPVTSGSSVIYKLMDAPPLPQPSITAITASDPDLSLFNEAITRTNLSSNFTNGNYTLLMPNNNAFINAGYPDIASIDSADINVLTQLLFYHVIPNTFFTQDMALQSNLNTLQGGNIAIDNSSSVLQLKGNSDPMTPAVILSKGIPAGNVVAFKISQVLIP
jgi:uncharacterized surface protein with fasciclin (FAS1) repeats